MGTEPGQSRGRGPPSPPGCSSNAKRDRGDPFYHSPAPLTAPNSSGNGRKTLLENPGRAAKPFHRAHVLRQHPRSDAVLHPQHSPLLYYPFSKVSLSNSDSFERSSCSPLLSASFPAHCGVFLFLQRAYLLIFHTGQSNTFCTCGDLHLQDPRGSLPSLTEQKGGLGDRKMHDSFKLLLLSPSRTQLCASTQKAFLLFTSY